MNRIVSLGITLLIILFSLSSCMTFTDFQSAKTVGKGNFEFTPSLTGTFAENERYPTIGINMAYGVTDQFDVRASFSKNMVINSFSLAPKLNLLKDKISLCLPVGTFWTDWKLDIDRVYVYEPTLLLTLPINKDLDLTFAPKYILLKNEVSGWQKPFFAPNIGLSIHHPGSKITFRPEFGMSFWPDYVESHIGIGLAFKLERKVKQKPAPSRFLLKS